MRLFIAILLIIGALSLLSGCHSGTMRGAGSDVEKLGSRMER